VLAIYLGADSSTVGVELPETGVPETYVLAQNYPNPFNPSTTIKYGLPEQASVSLRVYNVLGQEVARLVEGQQTAGYHEAIWDGRNIAGGIVGSGVYFYRLEARPTNGGVPYVSLKKMMYLK
jgi:flagellar hook assembly protein FlgD